MIYNFIKVFYGLEKEHVALFHPFSLRTAYIKKGLFESMSDNKDPANCEEVLSLKNSGFIGDNKNKIDEEISHLKDLSKSNESFPDVFILKIFITTKCNFDCRYCLIEQNIKFSDSKKEEYLSIGNARKAIDEFCELSKSSKKNRKVFLLYGGEPLLNLETVKFIVAYIREKEKNGTLEGDAEIILETNGSLITDDIACFLSSNNVTLIVSIDGPHEVHDSMRVYKGTENPTLNDVLNGMNVARKNGCLVVTSAVFHDASALSISEVIEYLSQTVRTPSTGLDLIHLLDGQDNPGNVNPAYLENAYIQAFLSARKYGFYIEHVMRRIRPFIEEKFRLRDCGACGSRIVVAPDGKYGQCEGFIHSRKFFSDVPLDMSDYIKTDDFESWRERLHLNFEQCKNCEAIGICGGGCAYNSYVDFGTIYNVDSKTCNTSKSFIKFLIWDLYEILREKIIDLDLYIPSVDDKRKILKSIPHELDLPLMQSQSKIMEVKCG